MLLSRFLGQLEALIPKGSRLLLAVSGGRDSVVLEDLCHRGGLDYAIAHCNFHLRPGDCDRDEQFVRELAQQHGVPCHVVQFDTRESASELHLSIEDAARRLRYRFFEQIRQQQHLDYILTAHHRDDSIETFFLNLLRGTGIAGLHGIRSVNGVLVRPMLIFGRNEIDAYVQEHSLAYVEDATNASLQYRRNQVRHQLMPLLREMSPGIDASMQQTIAHLSDVETVYRQSVEDLRQRLFRRDGEAIKIPIAEVAALRPQKTLLFELLSPYGFNITQVENIIQGLASPSGRHYSSPTHFIAKDRDVLILMPLASMISAKHSLVVTTSVIPPPCDLSDIKAWSDATHAYFDADHVALPLTLRRWRQGDRFYPFGMKGSQLVSDYFSDHKYSLLDKQRQYLLVDDNDQILWIIGRRTDRRAQVTSQTMRVLEVTLREPVTD